MTLASGNIKMIQYAAQKIVKSHDVMMSGKNTDLVKALQSLKRLQNETSSPVLRGQSILGATQTKTLVQNGFLEPVIKGWFIASSPAHAGTTVTWYASFWHFIAAYCSHRFGEEWCLTPEESLLIHSGINTIPQQVIVRVRKGSNTVQALPHQTSILNITASLPSRIEREATYGLHVYPLAEALLRSSAAFYANHATEARACLYAIQDDAALANAVHNSGGEAYAGRLIGALESVGRRDVADSIRRILKEEGRRIDVVNPFAQEFAPVQLPQTSPVALRLRLLWAEFRPRVQAVLPPLASTTNSLRPIDDVLREIDARSIDDSYHSLSIEGYKVSEDLIHRIQSGEWNPQSDAHDHDQRNALAAAGYYRAFRKVRETVAQILNGADAGATLANAIADWHRELFMPCVEAGILDAHDLAGYRRGQVYIAGSRYTPPPAAALADAMDAFLDLLRSEPDDRVRAILGHFFFVYIHPYADGNGRTARFIMNAALVAGGGHWLVIPITSRDRYMASLESASTANRIEDFATFLTSLTSSRR